MDGFTVRRLNHSATTTIDAPEEWGELEMPVTGFEPVFAGLKRASAVLVH